ncbi:RHS repeat protein [Luteimonas sp. RD2P54]|uniref:RHS repeat protein n=1 Tax=Luteimonas endophytica TaxID=3042023 RepID=A0ABT6JDD1_9GAMM|nr:RHS repeat protein [Luteimonas endophytica]MDH5824647.1 RHS repeat protein [Luteimonas endophytica]
MIRPLAILAIVALCGLAMIPARGLAQEQSLLPYQEYDKRIRAAEQVGALDSSLFGEQINMFDQQTSFGQTDIDLPGNNSLRVELRRSFSVRPKHMYASNPRPYGGAGDWDIDVPHISGTFDGAYGWNIGTSGERPRCSSNFGPRTNSPFRIADIWSGNSVHIPGRGTNEILAYPDAAHYPPDGKTHLWTTRELDSFGCTPMASGYPGEGFVMRTREGVEYTFDVGTTRLAGSMGRSGTASRRTRVQVFLLASRVEDRFGNWVTYSYNGDGHPTRIEASDGRRIDLTYSHGQLSTAAAHGRQWSYHYSGDRLSGVTLPDQSQWGFAYQGSLEINYGTWDVPMGPTCASPPVDAGQFGLAIMHPSGAVGTFQFAHGRRYRSGIAQSTCVVDTPQSDGQPATYYMAVPRHYDGFHLTSKTVSGTGISPALQWTYTDDGQNYPYGSTALSKTVTVTQPDGSESREHYGVRYDLNEGRLLGSQIVTDTGSVLESQQFVYVSEAEAGSQPFPDLYGFMYGGSGPATNRIRPLRTRIISRQGTDFTWHVNSFDVFGRPVNVSKSSTVANSPSKSEVIAYHDNLAKWVLGQQARLTVNGVVASETSYHSTYALPTGFKQFGKTVQTLTYSADGTVATVKDGNDNTTTLSSWKRGIPQAIRYPATPEATAGATQSAVVNDHGWITQVTDEVGFVTDYEYDLMGRLSRIKYPASDSVSWNPTTFTFTKAGSGAYSIPAGHWQHVAATGNGRKVTYLDALWRPVLVHEYDTANFSGTQRFSRQSFDHAGRTTFASYPSASGTPTTGTWTEYDALGRPISITQDSEFGALTTITEYLSGFQTRVTSPKNEQTHYRYLAWDQPTTDFIERIIQPEGAYTYFGRDDFGKPTYITRRNANGSVSLTRRYVYRPDYQTLCKIIEPEAGVTVQDHDGAGNLLWTASGLDLTSTANCSYGSVPASAKVWRTYDGRNRIQSLTFPDSLGDTTYGYTRDGKLDQVSVSNGTGASVTTAYSYNKRRLPVGEAVAVGSHQWGIGYGYNANGHLSTHTLPGGLTVNYAPNALGQPTQAGSYATGVSYFPNGAIKQFAYGNGITHTLGQNARGLPERSRDAYGSTAFHDDSMDYDLHGNVAAISDGLPGNRGDRTMEYDGLDRLTETVSPMFGTASYAYDVLDNLKAVRLSAGTKARDHTYVYDANHRLNLVTNTSGGATVATLGYDARGNLASRNGQTYQFDQGNRLRDVPGVESYRYDGHGRRVQATRNGASIYSVYGQDGVLRHQRDERTGKTTEYVYLGGSLVAQLDDPIPLATPTLTVPGYSSTGSYTVGWTPSALATKYQLEEQASGGSWSNIHNAAGTSKAVSSKPAGSYGYRIRACHASACGSWSEVATVTVQLAPISAPTLMVPPKGLNGSYTISWNAIAAADRYKLQERQGGGGWVALPEVTGTSKAFSGKVAGNWSYQVAACNDAGCGSYSPQGTVQSIMKPASAPTLTVPATNLTGSYAISWTSVETSTRYELQERLNSGSWSAIHEAASRSISVTGRTTGTWGYQVRACNEAGCGAYSPVKTTAVTRPPTSAPTLIVPQGTSTSGNYTISWTSVSPVTKYQLEERLGSGSWSRIHEAAAASKAVSGRATGSWSYRVQGCNAAGCGSWSSVKAVAVTRPPAAPAITKSIKVQTYVGSMTKIQCEVAWTATATAQTYELRAYNGVVQYSGPLTNVRGAYNTATYCANSHVVRACNSAGCSSWSTPPYPQGLIEVGDPGGPGVPLGEQDVQGEGA